MIVPVPFSLDIISDYLAGFDPPTAPFDPNGEWKQRYNVWIALRGPAGKSRNAGSLTLRRFQSRGARLAVEQTLRTSDPNRSCRTKAAVACADDLLSTPQSWTVESALVDPSGQPVELTQSRVSGAVKNGQVVIRSPRERTHPVNGRVTGSWCLLDAVQRMPFETRPITFDLLDDLELVKPDHRLAYRQAVEMELGGRKVRLHSFEQTGRGILPYTYWLDDSHRLLFAIGGLRTFILEPATDTEAGR